MKSWIVLICLLYCNCIFAQDSLFHESGIELPTATGVIKGTLTVPKEFKKGPVILFIAGSGPTDRDGNSGMMKSEGTKMLAHQLAEKGIASVRYDKRGVAASFAAGKKEQDLRFEDYVQDAIDWIRLLKTHSEFNSITIVGHSEGSLIGMIAAPKADKYISVAGVGQSADKTLKEQLAAQPPMVKDPSYAILDSLKAGKMVDSVKPFLYSLFRPSVQPYMISWFKYEPQELIKKLKVPILIIQGTNDIQVSVADANRLHEANPSSQLVLIENMNHIFRDVVGDRAANLKTYGDFKLPINPKLVETIAQFIFKK